MGLSGNLGSERTKHLWPDVRLSIKLKSDLPNFVASSSVSTPSAKRGLVVQHSAIMFWACVGRCSCTNIRKFWFSFCSDRTSSCNDSNINFLRTRLRLACSRLRCLRSATACSEEAPMTPGPPHKAAAAYCACKTGGALCAVAGAIPPSPPKRMPTPTGKATPPATGAGAAAPCTAASCCACAAAAPNCAVSCRWLFAWNCCNCCWAAAAVVACL
mmetsp:Transcript_4271/g.8982  ORF Transcript_4271/g.8982 Transcript_4271/m.8982 type:complete len:215 (+) Transcript_4271:620-1264(+)